MRAEKGEKSKNVTDRKTAASKPTLPATVIRWSNRPPQFKAEAVRSDTKATPFRPRVEGSPVRGAERTRRGGHAFYLVKSIFPIFTDPIITLPTRKQFRV